MVADKLLMSLVTLSTAASRQLPLSICYQFVLILIKGPYYSTRCQCECKPLQNVYFSCALVTSQVGVCA